MTDVVYGRRPLREALRGRRRVGRIWCSARAREALAWLPGEARVAPPARLTELAGSDEHQGVVAEVSPYPYADAGDLLAR